MGRGTPPADMATTVQPCAARCGFVAMLLAEIARARGTSEDVQRVTHGLPSEDHNLRQEEPDV